MTVKNDPALFKTNFARRDSDQYYTEPWVTSALIDAYPLLVESGPVWEPACGRGDIVSVFWNFGVDIDYSDIDTSQWILSDMAPPFKGDFLKTDAVFKLDSIVTNPPYNLADDFLRKALSLPVPRVAMLLRSEFKHAKKRQDLMDDLTMEVVLTSRPRWDDWWNGKPPKAGPRHNFSWFIWDRENITDAPVMTFRGKGKK